MLRNIFLVFIIGFVIRIIMSILINSFPQSFYSISSNDALGFSMKAAILSENLNLTNIISTLKWNLYPFLLSIIYYLTFPNIYIGSIFTILIWSISFIVIYDTLKKLELSNFSILLALTFYSFFPTLILFSSITLRDVFILLFFNITFNFFVRYFYKKYFTYLVIILIQALLIFLMHKKFILLFYMIFPLIYIITFTLINICNKKFNISYVYLILSFVLIVFNIDLLIDLSPLYEIINNFQTGGVGYQGRASYIHEVFYVKNIYDFLYYAFVSFYYYMLAPFVFELNKIRIYDFIVIFENLIRFMIIFLIFFKLRYLNNKDKYFAILFSIIFFSIELSWALGTFNWGTAIRHHLSSLGVLTILVSYIVDIIRKKNDRYN